MLSQLCRDCQGNNAEVFANKCREVLARRTLLAQHTAHYALTITRKPAILNRRESCPMLGMEVLMADEKLRALRSSQTLHPHPDRVRDPLFTSGSPFFDPRDLIQVKYELLRRVRVEGEAVSQAAWRWPDTRCSRA